MYYYKKKKNPLKWIAVIIILIIIAALIYWFYINYFSKIEVFNTADQEQEDVEDVELLAKKLAINVSFIQGQAEVDIDGQGYQTAVKDTILHQGDKIKTGQNSLVSLNIEDSC